MTVTIKEVRLRKAYNNNNTKIRRHNFTNSVELDLQLMITNACICTCTPTILLAHRGKAYKLWCCSFVINRKFVVVFKMLYWDITNISFSSRDLFHARKPNQQYLCSSLSAVAFLQVFVQVVLITGAALVKTIIRWAKFSLILLNLNGTKPKWPRN